MVFVGRQGVGRRGWVLHPGGGSVCGGAMFVVHSEILVILLALLKYTLLESLTHRSF